jgi:hypothetical protein
MTAKVLSAVLAVSGLAIFMNAADMMVLNAGRYVSTISPAVNEAAADRIESQINQLQEISSNDVKTADSSLHFTVKKNAQLDVSKLREAVKAEGGDYSISNPELVGKTTTMNKPSAQAPGNKGLPETSNY